MDAILQPILQSPKLPDYVEVLKCVLEEEEKRGDKFYHWLDEDKRAEFIKGEVIIHSPARMLHIVVLKRLMRLIDNFVESNNAGTVLKEQAPVRLKRSDVLPDLAFWKNRTFSNNTTIFPVPDFVIEVLSSNTQQNDSVSKKEEYALNGIAEYWIADPDAKTIEQYVLTGEEYVLREKLFHGTIQCVILQGLEIELKKIFE